MLCTPEFSASKRKRPFRALGAAVPSSRLPEHATTCSLLVGHLAVEVSIVGRTAGKVTHGRGSGLTVIRVERPDGIGSWRGLEDPNVVTHISRSLPFCQLFVPANREYTEKLLNRQKNRRSFTPPPPQPPLLLVFSLVCLVSCQETWL